MIQHKDACQAIWETLSLTLLTRCVNIVMLETGGKKITCQTCFKQNEIGMVFVMGDVQYFFFHCSLLKLENIQFSYLHLN